MTAVQGGSYPVEPKVKAATTSALIVGFVVQLLSLYVFHGEVPDVVVALVGSIVTAVLTFVAGWLARHVNRPPAPEGPQG
jgi:uncharacterized membrane protein YeaQ/YmgE (transglycosylase-associated protein family)